MTTAMQDISLGTACPEFRLPATDGTTYALADFADKQVLVMLFICNHCPYVKAVEDRVLALAREYGPRGVQLVGVCSNDWTEYPEDSFVKLCERWTEKAYGFPYLHDEQQHVARAFGAVCTPDIYVYDRDRKLAYHGRIDDNWKDEKKVRRRELAEALDALLAGRAPAADQKATMGCSIKWTKKS